MFNSTARLGDDHDRGEKKGQAFILGGRRAGDGRPDRKQQRVAARYLAEPGQHPHLRFAAEV